MKDMKVMKDIILSGLSLLGYPYNVKINPYKKLILAIIELVMKVL